MEWISIKDRLPDRKYGVDNGQPEISEDVAVYFSDVGADIANYDHVAKHWSLVNRNFDQPDINPTHWCSLPEWPNGQRVSDPAKATGEAA